MGSAAYLGDRRPKHSTLVVHDDGSEDSLQSFREFITCQSTHLFHVLSPAIMGLRVSSSIEICDKDDIWSYDSFVPRGKYMR
jgi:hypothetical protein